MVPLWVKIKLLIKSKCAFIILIYVYVVIFQNVIVLLDDPFAKIGLSGWKAIVEIS